MKRNHVAQSQKEGTETVPGSPVTGLPGQKSDKLAITVLTELKEATEKCRDTRAAHCVSKQDQ